MFIFFDVFQMRMNPFMFSLTPLIFHEDCPYRLHETDGTALSGGLKPKNTNQKNTQYTQNINILFLI